MLLVLSHTFKQTNPLNKKIMSLKIGDKAPLFTLTDSDKKDISLADLKGKNVVLLFYPAAFTGTCTKELCQTRDELSFYKRMQIPIPRNCPECRHMKRFKNRGENKLWHRKCMCDKEHISHKGMSCDVEFETTYSPDRPEIVYCEKCYQQEVY